MSTDTKLNDLSRRFNEIQSKYDSSYNILRMLPTDDAVDAYPKGCVAKSPGNNNFPIGMQLLNNSPQTYETCKIGASLEFSKIKYNELQDIQNNNIQKSPGLKFTVVDGYFVDNPLYFLNGNYGTAPVVLKSDYTTDVTNLDKGTNGYLKNARNSVSVEWQGYVIPDSTGNWNFNLGSDDASYMWLGNHALYDYKTSNAQIKNGGLHGYTEKNGSVYLIKGQIYPLRIQYGNNYGGMFFSFYIKSPGGDIKTNNVLFVLKKGSDFYEMKQRYFALVQNPSSLGYSCYVADSHIDNEQNKNLKLQNISSDSETQTTIHKVVWKGLDDTKPDEVSKIKPGNYAKFGTEGLVIYDKYNTPLKTFKVNDPHPTNPQFVGKLIGGTNTGDTTYFRIQYKKKDNTTGDYRFMYATNPSNMKSSNLFRNEIGQKKTSDPNTPNEFKEGEIITATSGVFKTGVTPYTHKLTIDTNGNLVLLCSVEGCSETKKNASNQDIKISSENAKYLYALDVDEKQNNYFYADTANKVLEKIPASSDSKNGGVLGFTDFIAVGNYMPDTTKSANFISVNGLDECKTKCKTSTSCDTFFYKEYTNNTKYCLLNSPSEEIIPLNSTNPVSGWGIKSSKLYIKNKYLDMSSNYMANPIPTSIIDSYNGYANYSNHTISGNIFSSPKTVGPESTQEWKNANSDLQRMLWGTRGKDGFTTVQEGLVYSSRICSGNTQDGCIRDISNNKIAPLKEKASKYNLALQKLSQNRLDLSNNIASYNSVKGQLEGDAKYKFAVAHDPTVTEKPDMLDGLNDDANEMLLQQNNMYLMGTLTTASLLILAIILSK